VPDIRCEQPFARGAQGAFDNGWLPVPGRVSGGANPKGGTFSGKEPAFAGITARKNDIDNITGDWVDSQIERFTGKANSLLLWLDEYHIGFDVDHYEKETASGKKEWRLGGDQLAEMEKKWGKLPDTVVVTARADGVSGIRLFELPRPLKASLGKINDAIEIISRNYRCVAAPPSYHVGVDGYVKAYLPGEKLDGNGVLEMPSIEKCAMLPDEWFDALEEGGISQFIPKKDFGGYVKNRSAIEKWLEQDRFAGEPCAAFVRILDGLEANFGKPDPHHWFAPQTFKACCMAMEGHVGLLEFLNRCEDLFEHELEEGAHRARDTGEISREWDSLIDGAILSAMTKDEDGMFIGYPDKCNCPTIGTDGRPMHEININQYDFHAEMEPCYRALGGGIEKVEGVYLSGNVLSSFYYGRLEELDKHALRDVISGVVSFRTTRTAGRDGPPIQVPAIPPLPLLESLLSSPRRYEHLPALDRFARTPFYAWDDGKPVLVRDNGYHEKHRVIVELDDHMLDAMDRVDGKNSDRAMSLIRDVFCDFPFAGNSDFATVLSALLIPFVRDLFEGPTPLHMIDAPTPRTGKGLLARTIAGIVLGPDGLDRLTVMPPPSNNVEFRKTLFATLMELPSIVQIDNIEDKLSSPALAMILTEVTFKDRVLGLSKMARPVNKCLWIATGNNPTTSDEIARRIVSCRLDSGTETPHKGRKFRHADLPGWVREKRHEIVWACLTLVQNWINEDMPEGEAELGGFEDWARIVGGILECAGIGSLLANQDQFLLRVEDESEIMLDLVKGWASVHGIGVENSIIARDLLSVPNIDDLVDYRGKNPSMVIGRKIGKMQGRIIGGFKIERVEIKKELRWVLSPNSI